MRRVIFNQKGGVGKSSIACNLAAISASRGLRTLVIDLDIQGNSSHYLMGQAAEELEHSIADYFKQTISVLGKPKAVTEFVHQTPLDNLFLLSSHPKLEVMERELETRQKNYKLRSALNELQKHYDRIYIDTPPSLNFYSRSALIAADSVLIPFDCDDFSRKALYSLMNALEEIRDDHNEHLSVEGIVANQFQPQARLPRQLIEELKEEQLPVLKTYIGSSVKMRESHQRNLPLIHSAPKHKLTQQFEALWRLLEGQDLEEVAIAEASNC